MHTARERLQCLLDQGFISQAYFNSIVRLVGITDDLGVSLALASMGNPLSMVSITPIDDVTPVDPAPAPEAATKVVLTAHGNDVLFTVTGDNPASGVGHVLQQGVNSSMTVVEYNAILLLALNSDSTASVTATFYA
jgi:hypothetical protein